MLAQTTLEGAQKILIVTPVPKESLRGNRITAQRWAAILRYLGYGVEVAEEYRDQPCDAMVALHARRSLSSVRRYRRRYSRRPLIVALTGTDLYHDLQTSPETRISLELADRLIVLQQAALDDVPPQFREKVRVIYQSAVPPPAPCPPREDVFEVSVLAHLRPVKDPFLAAEAVRRLPPHSRVQITHMGEALSLKMAQRARREMKVNPRYRWIGNQPRGIALRILARSRLLLVTSQLEGGANSVSEAIAAGVPVLSTSIPGSIGILGADYPGYFRVGDAATLATLLMRTETDREFLYELTRHVRRLKPLVDPAREREAWRALLDEIMPGC